MDLKSTAVILFILLQWKYVLSEQEEGWTCKLKDESAGVCTKLSECKHAIVNWKSFKYPNFCSYNRLDPIVCCPDCPNIKNRTHFNFMIDNYSKISEECLEELYFKMKCNGYPELAFLDDSVMCYGHPQMSTASVAGGTNANRNEFPHMALIGYGNNPDSAEWMCGGSVISDRYILSAAHCISSPSLGEIKYAALGLLKRTDRPEIWQKYEVVRIIAHPGYKPPSKYNDIALLMTGRKIRFNGEVVPACLHRGFDSAPVAQATGWGAMGYHKPLAEILQVVDIYKFSDAECRAAYPVHRHLKYGYDPQTQMCYGDEQKISDTCEGDSGGPLQIPNDNSKRLKCLYTIIGITSYGRACGYVGSSGMYTRVAYYVPWIESITGRLIRND